MTLQYKDIYSDSLVDVDGEVIRQGEVVHIERCFPDNYSLGVSKGKYILKFDTRTCALYFEPYYSGDFFHILITERYYLCNLVPVPSSDISYRYHTPYGTLTEITLLRKFKEET